MGQRHDRTLLKRDVIYRFGVLLWANAPPEVHESGLSIRVLASTMPREKLEDLLGLAYEIEARKKGVFEDGISCRKSFDFESLDVYSILSL